ncbi:transmembrane emp24 domain-containing protein 2-like [Nilaparvata lugens]|uniref:transmembrane emp24 domain-containing protein 2-like n=1 Tax=Nilaparvata lugens TaxID=108931 RepID=UPI00193D4A3D|nr:transmembrane emp24 domain-containing protein 2-like [Nilaparvata lugens]
MLKFLTAVFLLFSTIKCTYAVIVTVDAQSKECFFEYTTNGSKINFVFEVMEGGFNDIDVDVFYGRGNINIYHAERQERGWYLINAEKSGYYHYCFDNKMSTVTPKIVKFDFSILPPASEKNSKDIEEEGIEYEKKREKHILQLGLNDLEQRLSSVKLAQEYINVAANQHFRINTNTNEYVSFWVVFQSLVAVILTVSQVHFLTKFLEVRRWA